MNSIPVLVASTNVPGRINRLEERNEALFFSICFSSGGAGYASDSESEIRIEIVCSGIVRDSTSQTLIAGDPDPYLQLGVLVRFISISIFFLEDGSGCNAVQCNVAMIFVSHHIISYHLDVVII